MELLIVNIRPILLIILLTSTLIANAADEIHWTFTSQTSVTFNWRGSVDENIIKYGTKPDSYTSVIVGHPPSPMPFSSPGPFWEAKITNLQENTVYYYKIGDGPEDTFHTPLKKGSSGFTIFVQGDIGDTGSYFRMGALQDLIADGKPDFVVNVGDLTYGNAHGQEAVDQHFNDVMSWSRNAAYMPVWGNHEWDKQTDNLRNYKGRFDFPNPQISTNSPAISCCGEDWYWFDYGNVRFITLPEPWPDAWNEWGEQAAVLMAEAESNPEITFITTFVHRPAYSSGHHKSNAKLQKILGNLGDQFKKYVLNINGHSHNYERSNPQRGVIHITAGAGGSTLETDGNCLWKTCQKPSWSAFRALHLGTLKLEFTTENIQGSFICGPASKAGKDDVDCKPGEIIDRFSIGKKLTDNIPPSVPENIKATSTAAKISLTWQASIDNNHVSGYKIYQNGIQIGNSSTTTYNIEGLSASTTYTYSVAAFDPNGNTSIQSDPLSVTTKKLSSTTGSGSKALVFTSTDDATIKYNYPTKNFGSKKLETDKRSLEQFLLKFNITGINGRKVSSAKLRLYNINGSSKGGDFYYIPNDSWSESTVTWKNAPDTKNHPIASLGAVIAKQWYEVDLTSLIKTDGTYNLRVKSTSTNGADYTSKEYSQHKPQLVITLTASNLADTIAPTAPKKLEANVISSSQITLNWSAASDNVGVVGYKVFRNSRLIGTTQATRFTDSALSQATTYSYNIVAYDKAGNESNTSAPVTATIEIVKPPSSSNAILTFVPTDDATIKPRYPRKNFGSKKLEADANSVEHFLIKFNVSGITEQTVTSAKLRLFNINGSNKGGDFYRVLNNSWSESTVNWENAPTAEKNIIAALGAVTANKWYEVDISSLIRGNGIYSLLVKSTSKNGADYYSKETSNHSPTLVLSTEPSSIKKIKPKTYNPKSISVPIQTPKPQSSKLITDSNLIFSVPKLTRLAYLTETRDPIFGTKITRIADDTGNSTLPVKGTWGEDARHHYSKDQPWNSDGTLLVLENDKSPSQIYLDGTSYLPKYGKCKNYSPWDDRWHPSKLYPNVRINVNHDKLEWFDIVSCTLVRQWQLPFSVNYIGSGEGNISNDGRYILLSDKTRMFLVDMEPLEKYRSDDNDINKRIGPITTLSNCGLKDCSIDWVSVSPSGKYAVVSYNGDHLRVFNINPHTLSLTPRVMPSNSAQCGENNPVQGYIYDLGHADMALNPFDNNEDVIIGQRRKWCPKYVDGDEIGSVVMVRLKDNKVVSLIDPNIRTYPHHISARNVDRPGWVFVSFYNYPDNNRVFNDEIIALKIDGSMSVERLTHKHTILNGCYRCEAHPVPSRDGRRVIWAQYLPDSKPEIKSCIVDSRI